MVLTAVALSSLLPLTRLLSTVIETAASRTVLAVLMLELGAVMIALLPIALMTLAARGLSRLSARREPAAKAETGEPTRPAAPAVVETVSRRQAIERVAGAALFGTTSAALGWGMVRGRQTRRPAGSRSS